MTYSKKDIESKLQGYPSLTRFKRQLEFELALLSDTENMSINQDQRSRVMALLTPVIAELRRMETYIDLIPEKDGAVLKAMFIGGMTYKEIASALHIDAKTIVKRKNSGLTELAAMYSRLPEEMTQASSESPVKVQ